MELHAVGRLLGRRVRQRSGTGPGPIHDQEPGLLTGGKLGVESSAIALFLCTAAGIVMLVMAARRGKIVPPIWKRRA